MVIAMNQKFAAHNRVMFYSLSQSAVAVIADLKGCGARLNTHGSVPSGRSGVIIIIIMIIIIIYFVIETSIAFKILFIYLYIFFITNFSRCCGWLRFAAQPKFFLFLLWASRRLFCHNNNKDHDIEMTDKWYQHQPETVMHNKDNNITIMWDMPVNTDRTITANRPDVIVKDSVNSTCKLIGMTVPSDRSIALKEIEKESKYKDLELEIQRMWHMKTVVIPVVVGALGTVKKGMVENIKKVSDRATVTEIQKICMLGSA